MPFKHGTMPVEIRCNFSAEQVSPDRPEFQFGSVRDCFSWRKNTARRSVRRSKKFELCLPFFPYAECYGWKHSRSNLRFNFPAIFEFTGPRCGALNFT